MLSYLKHEKWKASMFVLGPSTLYLKDELNLGAQNYSLEILMRCKVWTLYSYWPVSECHPYHLLMLILDKDPL